MQKHPQNYEVTADTEEASHYEEVTLWVVVAVRPALGAGRPGGFCPSKSPLRNSRNAS
jgi:hypothetical protein